MTLRPSTALRPSLIRCLTAGLVAGLLSAAVLIPAADLIQASVSRTYPAELAPARLAYATVSATLLAAATFYVLHRWTARGLGTFAALAVGFALIYSLVVLVAPPAPGFGVVVAPLHLLVAATIVGVFALANGRLWTASPTPSWHGYGIVAGALVTLLLAAYLVVEVLDVPLLSDPSPRLGEAGPPAAAVGVGLLSIDVFIPVPSSGVMVAHGALFGVAGGTLLSVTGGLGATLVGFLIGRRSRRLVDRIVPPHDQERAEAVLDRYGGLAIIVTRPVPMLAETAAIIAGTSTLSWRTAAVAGVLGNLVPALLYALTGAVTASFGSQIFVFTAVTAVAVLFWVVERRRPGCRHQTTG